MTSNIELNFHFNTAISAVMELVNLATTLQADSKNPIQPSVMRECLTTTLLLLFPMVPHFCEELWEASGQKQSMDNATWPVFDPEAAKEDEITIIIQVNGKVRSRLEVPVDIDDNLLKEQALEDERVKKFTSGKEPKKIIVVQKKLVNIVL